jgi:hypothetical protein
MSASAIQIGAKMMWDKPESVQSIVKLIDSCTQCKQIFHAASSTENEPARKELTDKVRQKLDQFGIELRKEVRRMGIIEDAGSFRFEPISGESPTVALRQILNDYDQALKTRFPTHAQAMIARQHLALQQAYEQLLASQHAA